MFPICSKLACFGHFSLQNFFQPSQNVFLKVGKLAIVIGGRGQTLSRHEV